MKRNWRLRSFARLRIGLGVGLGMCLLILGASIVMAQQGDGYDLSWWTVDGGGGASGSGAGYSLAATLGQPDAGVLSGPGYVLAGGFWQSGGNVYHVYLPLVMRSNP